MYNIVAETTNIIVTKTVGNQNLVLQAVRKILLEWNV